MKRIQIEVTNRQKRLSFDEALLRQVIEGLLAEREGPASLSLAVVEDAEIAVLNRRFLGRDGPTDVLSFPYQDGLEGLDGEVIINAEEALRRAEQLGHGAEDELLLYAVHGTLHLMGYNDAAPRERRRMHERALAVLASRGRRVDARTLLEDDSC